MNARQWPLALLLAALVAIAGCRATVAEPSVESRVKAAVVVLGLTDEGTCSGVMIGPRLLLSASHCFEGGRLLTVNQVPVNVVEYRHDGQDHAVLLLDTSFPAWVAVNYGGASQGDRVFMYGNPAGILDILRRGYVMGHNAQGMLLDFPASPGDSGAAIFNEAGEVIGILSGGVQLRMGMVLILARPFAGETDDWPLVVED